MRRFAERTVAALAALAIVAGAAAEEGTITTLDGVFTSVQAKRGEAIYTGPCSRCHGYRLDGAPDDPDMLPAPPAAGTKFLRKWNCRSLAVLLEYLRATMPENNPGYLSDEEYTDLVTYMLSVSGMPAGSVELKAEKGALSRILMLGAESSTVKGACPRATRE